MVLLGYPKIGKIYPKIGKMETRVKKRKASYG